LKNPRNLPAAKHYTTIISIEATSKKKDLGAELGFGDWLKQEK
jgi:hypothetical protein